MMNDSSPVDSSSPERGDDAYLWDRSGRPDLDVARMERALVGFRYRETPLVLPPAAGPRLAPRGRFLAIVSIAAALVAALSAVAWRSRVASTGVPVSVREVVGNLRGASSGLTAGDRLHVGAWLETEAGAQASLDIGDIGRVDVDPSTRLGLVRSREGDYRIRLDRGTLHAVIWAPPGQFAVDTPSSTAVDLGCAYSLTVDKRGSGLVRVTSGWVGFEWRGRESFIPAGAVCETRRQLGPGTPRFDDTTREFGAALDSLDFGGSVEARSRALQLVLAEARPRDALTLWHLLDRVAVADRGAVFDRLAGLVPPPSDVTRDGILGGSREMRDRWWSELGYGTVSWWRTWKQTWRSDKGTR